MVMMAFRAGLCLSICAKCASSTSVAETWPARMAAANCVVLEKTISIMIAPACCSGNRQLAIRFTGPAQRHRMNQDHILCAGSGATARWAARGHRKRASHSNVGLGSLPSEKINIRPFYELGGGDAQCGHQFVSFLDARPSRLTLSKNHFEFQEVPESLHAIEVHTRSSHHIHGALRAHPPGLSIRQREGRAHRARGCRGRNNEEGFFRPPLVWALIENELPFSGRECTELQPALLTRKEGVVV